MALEDYDVMNSVLSDDVSEFVRSMSPETDQVFDEMTAYNVDNGFPIVGPEVGGVLRLVARMVSAERVFEFGSGMGYSAYWIAPVLPTDGELVLTDLDQANLDKAREFFELGGYADLARFELGDALETYQEYDGEFDLILIDNLEKEYQETFELVRDQLPSGGVICADNVMTGPAVQEDHAVAALQGDPDWENMDDSTAGVVKYLQQVRDDPQFETCLLPVGEGLVISVKKSSTHD